MDSNQVQNLKNRAISQILEAKTEKELEELRIEYLGRKGQINNLLKEIPKIKPDERADFGKLLNDVKKAIEEAIENKKFEIRNSKSEIQNPKFVPTNVVPTMSGSSLRFENPKFET